MKLSNFKDDSNSVKKKRNLSTTMKLGPYYWKRCAMKYAMYFCIQKVWSWLKKCHNSNYDFVL